MYVSNIVNAPGTVGSTVLQNATFDTNGNYLSSGNTAQGSLSSSAIISLNQSDTIGGVGGGYANVLNSNTVTQYFIMPDVSGYSSFLNQYGIWGDQNNSTAYNVVFPVVFANTGSYTITVAGSGNVSVAANGTTIATSTTTSATVSNHTFTGQSNPWNLGIAASSSGTTTSGVAVTITDPNGNLVFDTIHPLNYVNGANTGTGISTETVLPLGGAWFTGVTQLKLGQSASSNANFYVGSTITVTSKYIYQVNQSATYVPPPPAPSGGGGGGGGGGGCFTGSTVVEMADGTFKRISEVQIGDLVKNADRTKTNKVLYVEYLPDTLLKSIYSPDANTTPFATINHPLYIDGKLCSVSPEYNDIVYPFLNIEGTINPVTIIPATGQLVYNLWLDGDHTYTVNGYGTHSIIRDGALLRLGIEQGFLTHEEAMNLIAEYTLNGIDLVYGSHIFINLFGKLNVKVLNKFFATMLKDDSHPIFKAITKTVFKLVGKIANLIDHK